MKRDRRSCVTWALLAFGFASASAGTASAQYFVPEYAAPEATFEPQPVEPSYYAPPASDPERELLLGAEGQAAGGARRVLAAARAMIDNAVVVRGSCATWLNAVYRQAGGRFSTVFSGDRRGRFADRSQLRPGDWVQFVNHSYGGVGHSAIFIGWTDAENSVALTLSHPGQQRAEPGRFREYEFTGVYRIDRMRD